MGGQIVQCPTCGKSNRVPNLLPGKSAVCGACRSSLHGAPGTGHAAPIDLTDRNFANEIATGAAVVDFWAAWCGPCRMVAPVIEELAAQRSDIRFGKLNVDENPRTAAQFGVQSIPLLVFFKDGKERGRVVGAVPRGQIEAAIQQYLT
jgi:thioredoxin 1